MSTSQELLSRVADEFARRRWRDVDQAAVGIVRAFESAGGGLDADTLAGIPSGAFLAQNKATRADVQEACSRALSGQSVTRARPPLIAIDEIDSFKAAGSVKPQEVAAIALGGLALPEQKVKEYIAEIIGEAYLDRDWGGELSDIRSSRVELEGQRVPAAFLLKGSGTRGRLRVADLGKNGDQIRRLSKQSVDLYIVQHVGPIDEAVYDTLRDMILARRAEGNKRAIGSVWDGSEVARLFVAYGLIDRKSGQPIGGKHGTVDGSEGDTRRRRS